MRPVLACCLLALPLLFAGCLSLHPSVDAHVILGQVAIVDHQANATYDPLTQTVRVDLHGALRIVDTKGLLVRSFLTTKPCATLVTGRADSWLDKRVLSFADTSGAATVDFTLPPLGQGRARRALRGHHASQRRERHRLRADGVPRLAGAARRARLRTQPRRDGPRGTGAPKSCVTRPERPVHPVHPVHPSRFGRLSVPAEAS